MFTKRSEIDKELAIQEEPYALNTLSWTTNLKDWNWNKKKWNSNLSKQRKSVIDLELERTREREIKEQNSKKERKKIVYINTSVEEKKEKKTVTDVFKCFLQLPNIFLLKNRLEKDKTGW